jgi:two-component system, OmpR family, KDP operon response regulator KdpE
MEKRIVAEFDDVAVDFDRMELRRSGQIVPATVLEFRLLRFFLDNPECVFSREELIKTVWPLRERKNARTVDNSISHLRRKLETNPSRPTHFQTVRRVGYKFVSLVKFRKGTPSTPV